MVRLSNFNVFAFNYTFNAVLRKSSSSTFDKILNCSCHSQTLAASNVQYVLGKYAVEQKTETDLISKVSASFNFSLAYDSPPLLPLSDFYLRQILFLHFCSKDLSAVYEVSY